MSIDDERGLCERLDRALETITPAPAPIDGAVRRGKAIKLRRRAAAAAGLAQWWQLAPSRFPCCGTPRQNTRPRPPGTP